MSKLKEIILRDIYLIFAVTILSVGFAYSVFQKRYLDTANRTTGLILEVNHPGRSCYQKFEFAYGDKTYVGTSKCGASPEVGSAVEVLYRLNGSEMKDYQVKQDSNPWDSFYLCLGCAIVAILFQWMLLVKKKSGN